MLNCIMVPISLFYPVAHLWRCGIICLSQSNSPHTLFISAWIKPHKIDSLVTTYSVSLSKRFKEIVDVQTSPHYDVGALLLEKVQWKLHLIMDRIPLHYCRRKASVTMEWPTRTDHMSDMTDQGQTTHRPRVDIADHRELLSSLF